MSHLKTVEMNYFTHAARALFYSAWLLALAVVSFIHALFPMLFVSTTSNGVADIDTRMWNSDSNSNKPGLTD